MKRVPIAIGIFVAILLFTAAGMWQIKEITGHITQKLELVEKTALAGNYEAASLEMKNLEEYFLKKEHILAIFMVRSQTTGVLLNLATVKTYITQGHTEDLLTEIARAKAQVYAMQHLFLNIF